MKEFDALLRRAILSVHEGEESVPLETVRVFGCALDRHPEPIRDGTEACMMARRDLVQEEEASARAEIPEQIH